MATYISNGSGDWTTIPWLTAATGTLGPTAPAAGSPPSGGGDKIIIRGPHVVTYNVIGEFGDQTAAFTSTSTGTTYINALTSNAIALSGNCTLRASRLISTALSARGNIFIGLSATLDWGTLSDPLTGVNSTVTLHYQPTPLTQIGAAGIYLFSTTSNTVIGNNIYINGEEKTTHTFLTQNHASGATTLFVDSVSGWKSGDRLVIATENPSLITSTTVGILSSTIIQTINTVAKSVTISPPLNTARSAGTRVGNFTSNVTFRSFSSEFPSYGFYLIPSANVNVLLNNFRIENLGSALGWVPYTGGSSIRSENTGGIYYNPQFQNTILNTIKGICFDITNPSTRSTVAFRGNFPPYDTIRMENCVHYSPSYTNLNTINFLTFDYGSLYDVDNCGSFYGRNSLNLTTSYPANINVKNSFFDCSNSFSSSMNGLVATIQNCTIRSNSILTTLDGIQNINFKTCTLHLTASPAVAIISPSVNSFGNLSLTNCTLSGNGLIQPGANITSQKANIRINQLNNSEFDYRRYNSYYTAVLDLTARKNGTTSYRIKPNIANTSFKVYEYIPAIAGVPQRIECNLRFDSNYGTANPPSISFVGAGVNQTFTCPAVADTWHNVDLTLNPTSTDDIEVTVFGKSSNINGFVWLDGIQFAPFITDVRWYGFEVDKNLYRTIDANTTLTENQVSAYPYINNLDYVYDESRYWTVTNPTSSYIDLLNNVGKSLDFSNRGILLNSAALSSLNFDSNTNILTLSTFNLSAGNNFNAIQTTGGITVNDNSNISSITLIGSVSGTTARNLNGVIIDGTLTYNTNVDNIITYTNCNIGTVQNNGSGIVTINRLNSNVDVAGRNVVLLDNPTYINPSLNGGWLAIFDNTGTLRYYTNRNDQILLPNGSTGTWTYKVGRYQSRLITGSFSIGGTVNINPSYVQDLNVDQANVAIVSSYDIFRNTQQVYDYFSYYMTTSAALSYPQFYNYRTILDITDKNLILNPSASIPFAYNGATFTIKSQNLENGTIVKGVETTGSIYLSGSASLSAINIISDKINSESVVSLNSVNATSDIVYNTGDPFEIVYTNCNIYKVENLGSGDIRIKKINSTITDGTDAQISDYYPTYLNLSLNGGTIAIYDDSTTRQYFLDQNQTVELPYAANGPWTYRATKYGQRTIESNFTVDRVVGGIVNIAPTFQPDSNVFNTLATVSAYNTFSSVQNIYDYMSYYKTTNTGINYGDLTNVGSILDIGSRSLNVDILSPQLFTVDNNSISLSTKFLSAGDGSSVNTLKTTSYVYLSGDSSIRNITIQGSVYQNQVLSLTGVNVNNTILYKTDTPTDIIYTNCTVGSVVNLGDGMITITRLNSIITDESDDEVETVVPITINITADSSTYIAVYKPNGDRYHYGSGNHTLVLGGNAVTGNWSYKAAKHGYELYSGTFLINTDISSVTNIAPTLVIDSSVTVTNVSTVSAYINLDSTRKIYDYLSYYRTTIVGIDFGTFATRAIGSIIITKGLTLDNTATSVVNIASNILTVKSSGLNEEITIYTSGDFTTTNGATISNNVKIRATNIDSELELVGIEKLTLYPSSNERDINTNKGPEITAAIYRFKYGSTELGVLLEGDMYSRADVGTVLLYNFALESGNNVLNLGTFGQIQQVLNSQIVINDGIKKASRLIPHSTDI